MRRWMLLVALGTLAVPGPAFALVDVGPVAVDVGPAADAVDGLVEAVEPATDVVEDTVGAVEEIAAPITEPVLEIIRPVDDVLEPLEPIVEPVIPPIVDPRDDVSPLLPAPGSPTPAPVDDGHFGAVAPPAAPRPEGGAAGPPSNGAEILNPPVTAEPHRGTSPAAPPEARPALVPASVSHAESAGAAPGPAPRGSDGPWRMRGGDVGQALSLPLALIAAVALFLAVQRRIDARDPKLAGGVDDEHLAFG